MSGKVRITQEQADEMNWYRVGAGYTNKYDAYMDFQSDLIRRRIFVDRFNKAMDNGETDVEQYNMMHAYMTGDYEVEPEINDGDFLLHIPMNVIGKVINGAVHWSDNVENDVEYVNKLMTSGEVRHATPEEIAKEKERRWWAKHGREPWEIKQGDVLMAPRRHIFEVTADPKSHKFGYYTGGDEFDFDIKECKDENWKVICFRDGRKDMQA